MMLPIMTKIFASNVLLEEYNMNSALKKATSTPQLVRNTLETGQLTSKPNRQYLQDLESEVNKSRIAIVTIHSSRKT